MKNISDRKSWGVEWSPVAGLKFRLYNPKGTTELIHNRTGAGNVTGIAERMAEYARRHTVIHKAEGGTRHQMRTLLDSDS